MALPPLWPAGSEEDRIIGKSAAAWLSQTLGTHIILWQKKKKKPVGEYIYSLFSPSVRKSCFLPLAQWLEPDPRWQAHRVYLFMAVFAKWSLSVCCLIKDPESRESPGHPHFWSPYFVFMEFLGCPGISGAAFRHHDFPPWTFWLSLVNLTGHA